MNRTRVDMGEKAGSVAAERMVVPVETKQAFHLGLDGRDLCLGLRVARCINQRAAFKPVKKQEHVSRIRRLAATSCQPLQIRSPRLRRDASVTWPIGHLPLGKAHG
ncbi:hypothetical protein D3C77_599190 [compost metagenome]